MIEGLRQLDLVNDLLIRHLRKELGEQIVSTQHIQCKPFIKTITLELVQNPRVVAVAKTYIDRLLKNKLEYGYLYYLQEQQLSHKLDIQFNGEVVIECARYDQVVEAIDNLAKEWACVNTLMYEITRLELLYFFTLLMNPIFNWITVDFIVQGAKGYAHLIAAPNRLVRNRHLKILQTRLATTPRYII